ncbi:MAG TPA: globin domain-containing protein [Candidatus Binataceae bacterium]|nr:globin domain-containing protein [Candidatus Binataceae bacterium]
MTPENIALVRDSVRKLSPTLDDFGRVFYARLFKVNPELRAIFPGDMDRQSRALMAMVELIVRMLDLQDKLVPLIHYLGERHAVLNVKPEYYRPFGEALIWTLAWFLLDEFTPETRRAWEEVYRFMVDNMT